MNIKNLIVTLFTLTACTTAGSSPVTDAGSDVPQAVADAAPEAAPVAVPAAPQPPAIIEAHFSPKGGCTDMVVKRIQQAKKTVRLQAYTFTSKPIISALIASKAAGVDVQVVLDRSDVGTSGLKQLQTAGVPVKIDKKHVIAHNKVIVVDDRYVLTGSFNFTYAAEYQNAENCLTIENPGVASEYAANWDLHNGHSVAP